MVVKFQEIDSIELVSSSRFKFNVPSLPVSDGRILAILNGSVTLPQEGVAHVVKRVYGHPIGYRGGVVFDNLMSATFLESSEGIVMRSLFAWLDLVRSRDFGTSRAKSYFARNANLELYTSTGSVYKKVDLINLFPLNISYPEYGESAEAAMYTVQFNVDRVYHQLA
jgi:hypothetical protein